MRPRDINIDRDPLWPRKMAAKDDGSEISPKRLKNRIDVIYNKLLSWLELNGWITHLITNKAFFLIFLILFLS